jgi:uncharacterized phage infection (PIP) family protein YhgE
MNILLNHLSTHSTAPLTHTYIVGAGDGSQLAQWRELHSEHLHLAEAHPQQVKALQQLTQEREDVFAGAITPRAQASATLNVLTLPQYNSINTPTALQRFLPNVRHHSTETVAAQSLEAWLSPTALAPDATHTLVLNAPGQAHALLTATSSEVIQTFSWIIVSTAEEALYEDDVDSNTLDATLTQLGYACMLEDDNAAYPNVTRLYQRQPSVIERLKLISERDALTQLLAERDQKISEKTNAAEAARVSAENEATKQSQALEDAKKQLTQRTKERNAAQQQTEQQKTEHLKALEGKVQQLAQQDKQLDAKTQQLAERDQQLSEKTKASDDAEAARVIARSEAEKQSQALVEANKQASEHKQALDETVKQLSNSQEQLSQRTQERGAAQQQIEQQKTEHRQALEGKNLQLTERDKQLDAKAQQLLIRNKVSEH